MQEAHRSKFVPEGDSSLVPVGSVVVVAFVETVVVVANTVVAVEIAETVGVATQIGFEISALLVVAIGLLAWLEGTVDVGRNYGWNFQSCSSLELFYFFFPGSLEK